MGLLKVKEVATRYNLGQTKLYDWIAEGKLEVVKIGGVIRVREEAVEDFLQRYTQPVREAQPVPPALVELREELEQNKRRKVVRQRIEVG